MKRNIRPIFFRESDFKRAWVKLLVHCLKSESPITFGDKNEPKVIRGEIRSMVIIEGNAIDQILNGTEVLGNDPRFKCGSGSIQKYIDEYTMEYINWQRSLPEGHNQKFVYTYYDRFRYYPTPTGTFDQVNALKENLQEAIKNSIFSNRHQMITWVPWIDAKSNSPPCLQRVWITLVDEKALAIRLDWRSRDLFEAWHVNLIGLLNMINKDIAEPLNCELVQVIDICDSLHIYNGSWEEAKQTVKAFGS